MECEQLSLPLEIIQIVLLHLNYELDELTSYKTLSKFGIANKYWNKYINSKTFNSNYALIYGGNFLSLKKAIDLKNAHKLRRYRNDKIHGMLKIVIQLDEKCLPLYQRIYNNNNELYHIIYQQKKCLYTYILRIVPLGWEIWIGYNDVEVKFLRIVPDDAIIIILHYAIYNNIIYDIFVPF